MENQIPASKLPDPHLELPKFTNRPEFQPPIEPKRKLVLPLVIVGLVIVLLAWAAGFALHSKNTSLNTPSNASNNPVITWKTYTSPREKATFKYPSDWL